MNKNTEKYLDYLDSKYHFKGEVEINVMDDYGYVCAPDSDKESFGVFISPVNIIYVAGALEDKDLFHVLSHELCHFIQKRENRCFDEDEANEFADKVVEEYFKLEQ